MADSVFAGRLTSTGTVADGQIAVFDGTTGLFIKGGSGGGSGYVSSITGTANQVIASAATGAVTLSLPQDVANTSSPTFLAGTFGGTRNLQTTSTDGIVNQNTTAATLAVPVQISPRSRWTGTGWDADDAVSRTVSFFAEVLPTTANTVRGSFRLGFIDPITAAITYPLRLTGLGQLLLQNSSSQNIFNHDSNGKTFSMVAGAMMGFTASTTDADNTPDTYFTRVGVGTLGFNNTASNAVSAVLSVAGTIWFKNIDGTTDTAIVKSSTFNATSAFQANGTPGVTTFGPAAVASITVKQGIVTAIS